MKKFKTLSLIMLCITIIASCFMLISCGECDHDWSEWAPTGVVYCDGGEEARTCSKCGEQETRDGNGDYSLHEWTEWTETTKVTCTENGEATRSCTKCPKVETKVVTAEGHTDSIICQKCQAQLVELPEITIEEGENYTLKITDFDATIIDDNYIEESSTSEMLKLFEAYVTIDENGNLYGYGNGVLKSVGTNTKVECTSDLTVYFLDGYVYLRNVGNTDTDSTLNETTYNKKALTQQDVDEIKGTIEQVTELLPKIEAWYNDTLIPLFNDTDFDKYPDNVKAFVIDTINDLFVKAVNDDKTVSYVINFSEASHWIDIMFEEPICSDIDAIFGAGTFADIKEFVTSDEFYLYDVDDLLNYIQVEQGVDLEALFTALDDLAVIVTGQEDATFEMLLSAAAPLPEGFDIYDYITNEDMAKLTVMEAILQALEAPMEDDPETADVNERTEAEKAVKEMVLGYFDLFEKTTFAKLYLGDHTEDELEEVREELTEQIDLISDTISFELCMKEDGSFNFASATIKQYNTTFTIKLSDNIYFTYESNDDSNTGKLNGTIIVGGEAIPINQDVVDEILAVFENDDKITVQTASSAFSGEASSREFFYIIDGVLYRFEIYNYHTNDYDESNYSYNLSIKIDKYTGNFDSISATEKCGGGYIYEVEMAYYETKNNTYSVNNVIAPRGSSYAEIAEIVDFQALDLDELGVEFEKEIETNSFFFYFDEDGEFFIANSNDYDSAMHTYINDEERSTESNGECEYIYYSSYKCTKCDSSYTNYFTDGHTRKLTYSYKDGVYYATLSCTVCEKIFDNQATFTLESDITTEYYESDTYAGFTVTIDEATAGKYYVYSESDKYADTYIDVYKVNSEGELDSLYSADGGESNGNFGLNVELEAGATYVFAPRMYYSSALDGSPNVTVFLEKVVDAE